MVIAVIATTVGCGDKSATNPTTKSSPAATDSGTPGKEKTDAKATSDDSSPVKKPSAAESPTAKTAEVDDTPRKPATVDEARRALDLTTFPLPEGAETGGQRAIAHVRYRLSGGDVKSAYDFVRQKLTERGWKEAGESFSTAEFAQGNFAGHGFHASVYAGKDSSKPGSLHVTITNQGNLNLKELPVPSGAKVQPSSSPSSISYLTDKSSEETAAAVEKLLVEQGWTPYGQDVGMKKYKQNAIELMASIAPGPGGQTVLSFHQNQMSADLPAPLRAVDVTYTDHMSPPKQLMFETAATRDELYQFYRDTLAKDGWEPTSEQPITDRYEAFMVFRNAEKDLLHLETRHAGGRQDSRHAQASVGRRASRN